MGGGGGWKGKGEEGKGNYLNNLNWTGQGNGDAPPYCWIIIMHHGDDGNGENGPGRRHRRKEHLRVEYLGIVQVGLGLVVVGTVGWGATDVLEEKSRNRPGGPYLRNNSFYRYNTVTNHQNLPTLLPRYLTLT